MNILYLPLEFEGWLYSRSYPYCYGIGLCEGFKRNNISSLTIPLTYKRQLWIPHIQEIAEEINFDQVWIEIGYSNISEELLKWLNKIPVRVGMFHEDWLIGFDKKITKNIENRIPYMTHIVTSSPKKFNVQIPVFNFIPCVPERLIRSHSSTCEKALFFTTTRQSYDLNRMTQIDLVGEEGKTNLPALYNQLFTSNYILADWPNFYRDWYNIKQALVSMNVDYLYSTLGCGIVLLPHQIHNLLGQIMLLMASGKPVLVPFMNGDNLFVDTEEILYYKGKDELYEWIDWLRKDADFRFIVADNARVALFENHTTEVRVKQILEFIKK